MNMLWRNLKTGNSLNGMHGSLFFQSILLKSVEKPEYAFHKKEYPGF